MLGYVVQSNNLDQKQFKLCNFSINYEINYKVQCMPYLEAMAKKVVQICSSTIFVNEPQNLLLYHFCK